VGEVGEQEEQGMGVEGEDGMGNWEEREKVGGEGEGVTMGE